MGIPVEDEKPIVDEKSTIVEDKPTEKKTKTQFRTVQLGIWEIVFPVSAGRSLILPSVTDLKVYLSTFGLIFRLFKDIYALAPRKFFAFILAEFAESCESGINLYLDSQIWDSISDQIGGIPMNRSLLVRSLASRILISFFAKWIQKLCTRNIQILGDRVNLFFMQKSMHAALLLDPTTAEDPDVRSKLRRPRFEESETWETFRFIIHLATSLFKTFSQMALAFTLIRGHGASAPMFFVLCVTQPFISKMAYNGLWDITHLVLCASKAYERLTTLMDFAYSGRYREDRLNDGVDEYVKREFKKNREELGDTSMGSAASEWSWQDSIIWSFLDDLMENFQIFYFAFRIIFSPKGLTFGTLAVLREAATSMQWSIYTLTSGSKSVAQRLAKVKDVYASWDIQNRMKDGNMTYPKVGDEPETNSGMELEFRNVNFKYPGTAKTVLEDVSFKIKPGQMVVIVGVNGSGKSSIVKLFNRLYDPTEGEILVDGLPLASYKIKDIRRAMAILRQDHEIYPLSLRLNVALGCPDREVVTDEEVQAALEAGGANTFIEKLPKKVDTILHPANLSYVHFQGDVIEEMNDMVAEMVSFTDVSGGESQRLAAARTFMRLNGGGIRFVAADEPTSALDPEGELALFDRLREHRDEKTVVFITHRFGHLTKYADLILVMKDGRLVESGSHNELLEKDGEYKKLHGVQAQAFLPTIDESFKYSNP